MNANATTRLSPEREAEIRGYIATCTNWSLDAIAARELLAELAAVRAERDQARADSERLRAAHFHEAARLLEDTGHDDDAVNLLDTLADGIRAEAEDASDNRRRLYVDGKGNGWISICHDEGTEWIVPVQPEAAVEQDVRDVADETGSLREIGRCW
ncbi:hypothetical protein ABZ400_01830 [Streptomyces sp. NPDC005897]|uniref:hypothetical protein n=1 Tax=Streptomyces sp. NPDC005897 TaxID=3157081 RepID=UPI0033E23251